MNFVSKIIPTIWNYLIFGFILLIVRSPLAMAIVGFIGGVIFQTYNPEMGHEWMCYAKNQIHSVIGDYYQMDLRAFKILCQPKVLNI